MTQQNLLRVFIVEDNEWYRKFLLHTISLNPDFSVTAFETGAELLKALHQKPDVVSMDYRLPDFTGDVLFQEIRQRSSDTEVIVVSEQEEIETAVSLLKAGAYDYIVKSTDIRDRLLNTLVNIGRKKQLHSRITVLEQEVGRKYQFSNTLIGQSEKIMKVMPVLEKAASSTIQVSITGETGTGKEVVAKCIHYQSARAAKPFVALNIAAIPSTLLESELFGYEKGAFTGAQARRIGKFEEAHGGTLFLDEIGDMETAIQVKLLRAIQEKEITRIGGNQTVKTDCRIIVATHRNLVEEVKAGRFRQDLYYRLFGLTIELPPLRDRGNDILILAKHFISSYCNENQLPLKTLSDGAQLKLLSFNYPGNVRELRAVIELAVVMSNTDQITENEIIFGTPELLSDQPHEEMTMKDYQQRILASYLARYDNNVKLVAEKLDISPATIYRMLKEIQP